MEDNPPLFQGECYSSHEDQVGFIGFRRMQKRISIAPGFFLQVRYTNFNWSFVTGETSLLKNEVKIVISLGVFIRYYASYMSCISLEEVLKIILMY